MIDYTNELTRPGALLVRGSAEPAIWQGDEALKLSGLALIPDLDVNNGELEVQIAAEAACYAGIAFRALDVANYELVYAQPHCSGQWDALQYDPVFHNSNTWQLFNGAAFQHACEVPMNDWFTLRVEFQGDRAAVCIDDQEPLIIRHLAHGRRSGMVGLWSYLPAYFAGLRVSVTPAVASESGSVPLGTVGAIEEWYLEDFGLVRCEPGGILVLNRYLPISAGEARLLRQFDLRSPGPVIINFGFSDELALDVDGKEVFTGVHKYDPDGGQAGRGYVEPSTHSLRLDLGAGTHRLCARLKVTEHSGWGLAVSLRSEGLRMIPARLTM